VLPRSPFPRWHVAAGCRGSVASSVRVSLGVRRECDGCGGASAVAVVPAGTLSRRPLLSPLPVLSRRKRYDVAVGSADDNGPHVPRSSEDSASGTAEASAAAEPHTVGVGVGVGVGVAVGVGDAVGVAHTVGVAVADGARSAHGVRVGVGDGDGVALGVGVGVGVAVGVAVADGVAIGDVLAHAAGEVTGEAARCHSSSPASHWCGSGGRNSKYSTWPVFSLTHANTYWLPGWIASCCFDEALAASAAPTPMPVHATAVVARINFSLGAAKPIVILPNRCFMALQIVALAPCTSCVLRVYFWVEAGFQAGIGPWRGRVPSRSTICKSR
jgi:hypothetical protein